MEASLVLMLLITTIMVGMQTQLPVMLNSAHHVADDDVPVQTVARTNDADADWNHFADLAAQKIVEAMTSSIASTPQAMKVSFYVGPHGHVRHPRIERGSGNPAVDQIVEARLLPGLELEVPPAGLRMPLVMWVGIIKGGWIFTLNPAS